MMFELHSALRSYLIRKPSEKRPVPVVLCNGFKPPMLDTVNGKTSVVAGIGWVIQRYYM